MPAFGTSTTPQSLRIGADSLDADCDDWGTRLALAASLEVELEDAGHVHETVLVDPYAVSCEG